MSWHLEQGDCREVLKQWAADGVLFDSCVTDPPYDLTSIVKRFGKAGAAPAKAMKSGDKAFSRLSRGFMGQTWDGTGVAFDPETWRAVYDVLKPGAHLVAFGGTRTSHRMTCAIEDAGFEVRDTLLFCFGVGFPKSHDVSKALWKEILSCQRSVNAPLAVQISEFTRLHCDEVSGHIVAAPVLILPEAVPGLLMVTGAAEDLSVPTVMRLSTSQATDISLSTGWSWKESSDDRSLLANMCTTKTVSDTTIPPKIWKSLASACTHHVTTQDATLADGRKWSATAAVQSFCGEPVNLSGIPILTVLENVSWNPVGRVAGIGSALKPAYENITLARKPIEGTVAGNTLAWGVGGINIDGCRVEGSGGGTRCSNRDEQGKCLGHPDRSGTAFGLTYHGVESTGDIGRWPANLCHDGSPQVLEAFAQFGESTSSNAERHNTKPTKSVAFGAEKPNVTYGHADSDTAARFFPCCPWSEDELRFFYSAKANKKDRAGSNHPTVKPISLMKWLTRLVTPPGGIILEPFAGSGSTIQAAIEQGFSCMAIEQSADYCVDIRNRMKAFANV